MSPTVVNAPTFTYFCGCGDKRIAVVIKIFFLAELLGDPHFTTLDGYLVTFNGIGEYILLTSNEFMFQGRMEQVTINGERKDASYITVLAAKQLNPGSGIVRMQATNASELGKIEEEYFIISYYNHKIK